MTGSSELTAGGACVRDLFTVYCMHTDAHTADLEYTLANYFNYCCIIHTYTCIISLCHAHLHSAHSMITQFYYCTMFTYTLSTFQTAP